ncbi:MAG: vitamin B12-dependent ribonucleotide reductase [Candidatus Zixiibacteriota bacterium]
MSEEILKKSQLQKADLTKNSLTVLKKRYLKRNKSGDVTEEPEDMFKRVAETIAMVDKEYEQNANIKETALRFYKLMTERKFMPNSPTLMNAGRYLGQLSACFVLPVEDSMDAIFETVKNTALIHKSGGGTGFSFSRLRPQNDLVHSTAGISSGPLSFMDVFDSATETVKQGGTRRGANMAVLRVDHPDILDFITVKNDLNKLNNFNISVGMTEDFMKAVDSGSAYDLINPRTQERIGKKLNAQQVFDKILDSAWATGEPGIIFLDRMNNNNPTPNLGEIESTNPCGEQPLLPYESCNLGSINLVHFAEGGKINWDKLGEVVDDAVHFLDNVIDANRYPIEKIAEQTLKTRKIGLGIMGFADLLFQLGIAYNSEKAVKTAEDIMRFIRERGHKKSQEIGEKRGSFPAYEGSIFDYPGSKPMRNATITTIAPTGSISIISSTSSGIEPLFALAYVRNVMGGTKMTEVHPMFKQELKERNLYSEELMKKIAESGTIHEIDEIPEELKQVYVTAHDVSPIWHIKIQAAFQKFTDNAVSKTVNFPNNATKEDVEEVYRLAYDLKCKGVTIYRDGSRSEQVLSLSKEEEKKPEKVESREYLPHREKRKRPDATQGKTYKVGTGCGSLYVTVNEDEHGIFEIFSHLGKSGGCAASQAEALSRMVSLSLRSGIEPKHIVRQLQGIQCPNSMWFRGHKILSCADAIAWALKWHQETLLEKEQQLDLFDMSTSQGNKDEGESNSSAGPVVGACPDCGATLAREEGCLTCHSCGFSKCG